MSTFTLAISKLSTSSVVRVCNTACNSSSGMAEIRPKAVVFMATEIELDSMLAFSVGSALATAEQAAQDLQDADLELRKVEPAVRSPASQMLATMTSRVNEMLTRREVEVLRLMADGRTNQQIADELIISPGTVKSHVKRVLRKLHATNRAEAASIYARLGNATTAL